MDLTPEFVAASDPDTEAGTLVIAEVGALVLVIAVAAVRGPGLALIFTGVAVLIIVAIFGPHRPDDNDPLTT